MIRGLVTFIISLWLGAAATAQEIRLKDLVAFDGVRGNDLVGYGLVVGLNGTGDGIRNAPFTEEIMSNLLERLGVNVTGEAFRPKNVAAVLVTAELPAFARAGGRIDVTVSAIGDAKSLLGGTLVMTPLNGADGQIYAVAQGTIIAGGIAAEGEAARVVQGVPTSGSIPAGARVEREVDFDFTSLRSLRLALRNPDFTTAALIENRLNQEYGRRVATMLDAGTVELNVDATGSRSAAHAIGRIENISIAPQTKLTLRVEETPVVVQPNPFAEGETVVVPRSSASIQKDPGRGLAEVTGGTTLSELVAGLNALGVAPNDMIDILKSIHAAGALHAEFVIN